MTQTSQPLDTRVPHAAFDTFLDVLRWQAVSRPTAVAASFCWFDDADGAERGELTYQELLRRAAGLSEVLRRDGSRGPVAILCPQGLDFLVGFVACLLGDRVAVPLHPKEPGRPDGRVIAAITDAGARTVLTTTPHRASTERLLSGLHGAEPFRVHLVDTVAEGDVATAEAPRPPLDAVAYLQYTSGSTRRPAGVRVTHGNLATGTAQLAGVTGLVPESRFVSWLPFFHDMGLIFALTALRVGAPATYLAPFQFVWQPRRWLDLLTTERATHSVTPNFGLDMCVTRVRPKDRAGLDLSALTVLVNGSEPIRRTTLDRFSEEYAPHGFRRGAHAPGYGLAEATLTVTCTLAEAEMVTGAYDRERLRAGQVVPLPSGHADAVDLVGCGAPVGQDVRIVEPSERTELPPGRVGEIWVRGGNVCAGYWERPETSATMFDAELTAADGTTSRGWLRTEDLGFFDAGHLYIVARLKDLVIIDGQNHYPADLEATLTEAIPAATLTAAFGTEADDRERLVLALELRGDMMTGVDLRALRRTVRRSVAERHGVSVHDVVFVRRGGIPRTSSGKVQRHQCRQLYGEGRLATVPETR
ncbi:fatty acyl-AMP ligase [Streptomyces sp. B6B3]|uniref:fatty acyl-AMP ligase n=1 Tax=Streptomyces sp. B6B3 TaxID=3153570 RepID=UPI00325D8D3A